MEALYAFCREVDDIADDIADPNLARVKLASWREEIHKLYASLELQASQALTQHPISLALRTPIEVYKLPLADFEAVMDGVERVR